MKLLSPKGLVSRPITDRVKESLFSVLNKYDVPDGKMVADLFSGVGSLGLEALSRGAEFATFVEKDVQIITSLRKNIDKAGFAKKCRVVRGNAFEVGAPVVFGEQGYALVFVDPPYIETRDVGKGSPLSMLLTLLPSQIAADGLVVVRTHRRTFLLDSYGELRIIDRREWGNMAVTMLQVT